MRAPSPTTLGALRDSGHIHRSVKAELRENLLARLAAGEPTFPGIVGFDETVLPELERALLAGHDLVLLGERGQGKTRLLRGLIGLLDEWTPVIAGSELNDHPFAPVSIWGLRVLAEHGDETPVEWLHRTRRYGEKLATPDTSVGDLIGDVDPIKVAEGRTLGDPETIHYGLVPRTNRGIIAVNELPDLAERIQVALLNVLEERDIQVRGYQLRLPLDLLVVASANPEDYTNRGRIITPAEGPVRRGDPHPLSARARRRGRPGRPGSPADLAGHGARRTGRAGSPGRGDRQVRPRGTGRAPGRPALRGQRTVRDRRGGDGGRRRRAPGRPYRRGRRGPGVRPADRGGRQPRQGRVRGHRGGP